MKTKIINLWQSLRFSFWFIPTLMVFAAITISIGLVSIDRALRTDYISFFGFLYSVNPEGARSILSAIAASMMTVAGVTFSITIVVLSLASSQFGPRLLRNFMQDRSIQFVLGTFVSSFIYCLIVLRSVQVIEAEVFVPNFSITFAVILALLNVGVLIYFIHHIATSIQVDEVIAETSSELSSNIERIFKNEQDLENKSRVVDRQHDNEAYGKYNYTHFITARRNGYLQAVDRKKLLEIAKKNDYLIQLLWKPGQFVVGGARFVVISSKDIFDVGLTDNINKAFIFGTLRTPEQDIEFSIHQLVEVAIRSLSPGINDPYTAMACIDQLGSVLCNLAKRNFPSSYCYDDNDKLRLKLKPLTYSGVLNASIDQIRQYGHESVAVTIRLLEMLTLIAEQTRYPDQRRAIHRQANMILRGSQNSIFEQNDRDDAQKRYNLLLSVLNEYNDERSYEKFDEIPVS
ncbi:MAG: DUF2254 domain-containing protein [Desulforhopalus sp.]